MVLNPAQIQRKSKETVMVANVEKMCLGMFSCFGTTADPTRCDRFDEIGALCSNPPTCSLTGLDSGTCGATDSVCYRIWHNTASKYMYVYGLVYPGTGSGDKGCYARCWYYYENGAPNKLQEYKTSYWDCLIDF